MDYRQSDSIRIESSSSLIRTCSVYVLWYAKKLQLSVAWYVKRKILYGVFSTCPFWRFKIIRAYWISIEIFLISIYHLNFFVTFYIIFTCTEFWFHKSSITLKLKIDSMSKSDRIISRRSKNEKNGQFSHQALWCELKCELKQYGVWVWLIRKCN